MLKRKHFLTMAYFGKHALTPNIGRKKQPLQQFHPCKTKAIIREEEEK
jgi:hypothetical protein